MPFQDPSGIWESWMDSTTYPGPLCCRALGLTVMKYFKNLHKLINLILPVINGVSLFLRRESANKQEILVIYFKNTNLLPDLFQFYANVSFRIVVCQIYDSFVKMLEPTLNKSTKNKYIHAFPRG